MGIITDPGADHGRFTSLLAKTGGWLCIVSYIAGIVWFLALAHKPFNMATYFSENALLPGLVRGDFDEDIAAKKYHTELKKVMSSSPNSIPYSWLQYQFNQMNLDSYLHNFTLEYPMGDGTVYHGQNLYAILRASRSSSIEGIVVAAPFRTLDSALPDNSASIALMLALAKYCRRQKYWAKDVVFLITDHEQLGTQAWLEAYHRIQLGSGILKHGDVVGRAGLIQAAINLELHSTKISHIDVKVEGLNGQLPNLDLVNLVHRLCAKEGVKHTFKNRTNPRKRDTINEQWTHSLATLLTMVFTQATCVPNGNHGLYHRFGIEAITIEGYEPPANYRPQVAGLYQVGRVLEGVLRSLNNLLERFHQSYFFYFLLSNDRFISIGLYMPAFALLGSPLLIKALAIWLNIYSQIKPKKYRRLVEKSDEIIEEKPDHKKPTVEEIENYRLRYFVVGVVFILAHLFGWLFVKTGVWLSRVGYVLFNFSTNASIYIGYFVYFSFSIITPLLFSLSSRECDVLNIIALVELATVLLTVTMHNFSLALILATLYVPCLIFVKTKGFWLRRVTQSAVLFIIHPYVLVHISILVYTFTSQGQENLISKAWSAIHDSFVFFIMDNMIYGNWFIEAVFGFLVPCWILFWILANNF